MLRNVRNQLINFVKQAQTPISTLTWNTGSICISRTGVPQRCLTFDGKKTPRHEKSSTDDTTTGLVTVKPKAIFQKEFPDYFKDSGEFITRISYVDFVDQALEKFKDLGLERNLEAYKELLKIFPPGKYCPKSRWDLGMLHAPQQLCAIRVLHQMEINRVRPDREVELIIVNAFSKNSEAWLKAVRMNFWSMKGRNIDPTPLPEKIPEKIHDLAKVALVRMTEDPKTVVTVTSTKSLLDVVDRTWIVYSQSPLQMAIIENLDKKSILYIEEYGMTYINEKYLSYFTLKVYDSEETIGRRKKVAEPDFNYNTLKMKFYGKSLKDKLEELNEIHRVDDGYILALGMTGTSSHDSLLSWLKIMQRRNPKLKDLSVVFRLKRPTNDIIDPNLPKEERV